MLERSDSAIGVDPGEFDHAIFGNVMQTSADALYGRARGIEAG